MPLSQQFLGAGKDADLAEITPSGLVASSNARTAGPRSGWCTAAKARAVMRASISGTLRRLWI